MSKRNYSEEFFKQITDFLDGGGVYYETDEEEGIIQFFEGTAGNLNAKSKAIFSVRKNDVMCMCYVEMGLNLEDPKEMARISEFITRANSGLIYGCFGIDYIRGDVDFTFTINLEEMKLSESMMCDLISVPMEMVERYVPGLERVKYAGMNPEEAIEMCEK